MVSFQGKLMSRTEKLGDVLRAYRESKGLSIKDVASKLGLAPVFVGSIESGKYNKLPGEVYVKNFIKRYAELFGINSAEALAEYRKERLVLLHHGSAARRIRIVKRAFERLFPVVSMRSVAVLLLIIVIGYVGFQARNIFSSPPLEIESPADGLVSREASIHLSGVSLPETKIQVNGREMITDSQGRFTEILDLTPGVNTFTIAAIKKHGGKTTVVRNIIFEERVSVAPFEGGGIH